MPGAKNYVFTLNNYTVDEVDHIAGLIETGEVGYVVIGREVAPTTNTPHLQGYVHFVRRKTLAQARTLVSERAHFEVARGTPREAIAYCKKDGNFDEWGEIPGGQGKRNDWESLREYVQELGRRPTRRELINHSPHLYARYERIMEICEAWLPEISIIEEIELRPWQQALYDELLAECNDNRTIRFYVDENGATGKTTLAQYLISQQPARVQLLGVGRRDDMAYVVDPDKDIFLIDVPRSQAEYLQYSVLEMLKNRMVMSNKYGSTMKVLRKLPHVVVFMNEHPDMTKLSEDRYRITNLRTV